MQYKTDDVTPVFWFHYTPDAIVVQDASPIKTFQDFVKTAKADPGKMTLGGSGLTPRTTPRTSAEHRRRLQDHLRAVQGHGRHDAPRCSAGTSSGAMSYSAFAINNKGKVRALAVAMDKRHPLLPDTPTFKELGFDWIDGAYRGIGMPKSTPPDARKRMSDLWAALNDDPEMKELAAKSGFELINVGVEQDGRLHEGARSRLYTEVAKRLGLRQAVGSQPL